MVKSYETGKLYKGNGHDHSVGVFLCVYECECASGRGSSIYTEEFFRNLVAAVFAAVILTRNHIVPRVQKQYLGILFLRCAFGTLGILCNFYAIDHLLVADASILNKLSPFFAIIFSFLILKEKSHRCREPVYSWHLSDVCLL